MRQIQGLFTARYAVNMGFIRRNEGIGVDKPMKNNGLNQ